MSPMLAVVVVVLAFGVGFVATVVALEVRDWWRRRRAARQPAEWVPLANAEQAARTFQVEQGRFSPMRDVLTGQQVGRYWSPPFVVPGATVKRGRMHEHDQFHGPGDGCGDHV